MDNRRMRIRYLAQAGVIGALYAVMTYVSSMMGLAYGEIQFRISEALTILPMFTFYMGTIQRICISIEKNKERILMYVPPPFFHTSKEGNQI